MSFSVRDACAADTPAFRALHDACLEVTYSAAWYATLFVGSPDVVALVAVGADGEIVGACTARVEPSGSAGESGSSAEGVDARGWWGGLLRLAQRAADAVFSIMLTEEGDASASAAAADAAAAAAAADAASAAALAARVAYIMTLCVAPSARRRGIARGLLAELITRALGALCCARVELHALDSNVGAHALYASLGFTTAARIPAYYSFGGGLHDALLLRLDVGSAAAGGGTGACDEHGVEGALSEGGTEGSGRGRSGSGEGRKGSGEGCDNAGSERLGEAPLTGPYCSSRRDGAESAASYDAPGDGSESETEAPETFERTVTGRWWRAWLPHWDAATGGALRAAV